MSAAGTAIVTSADGAGDMPSPSTATGGDPALDDAQPFSEVLSRSSSSDPPPSPSNSSSPPSTSSDSDESSAATVPPGAAAPARRSAAGGPGKDVGTPSRVRSHRGAGGSGIVVPPDPAASTTLVPTSGIAESGQVAASVTSASGGARDVDEDPGAPLPPTAVAASASTGGEPAGTLLPTLAPDAPSAAETEMVGRGAGDVSRTAVDASDDGPVPGIAAESASRRPDTPGAASSQDRPLQGEAATVRVEAAGSGVAEFRVTPNPGATPGAVAPHAPAVHTETTASSPAAADGVLSVAAGEASDAGAGVTEGIGELTEFPDGAGGTSGASVDVSGLAASISRPLASGNGDYSVQVSLHPPELGQVRALLSFQGDVLHVTLTPEHAGGFEALSDAMPALHEQLSGGGVEVNVTLSHPGDPQGSDNQGDAPGAGRSDGSDGATPVAASSLPPPSLGEPGRIHLVL